MKTLRQLGLKLAASLGGAALIALGAITFPLASAQADEVVNITEGSVTWGFKESWRSYIPKSGVVTKDGVTISSSGEYVWPISSGTYDPDKKSLVLKLGGSIQFLNHCTKEGDVSSCILNSTMSNLTLYLNESDSHIQGDYAGVPMSNWDAGVISSTDVRLASLSTEEATYSEENGKSNYGNIAASAGAGVQLYAEGIALDPISISYTGSGGLPAIDTLVNQGVPRFAKAADWDSTKDAKQYLGGWGLYSSSISNTVFQIDNQVDKSADGVQVTTTTIRAIDTQTMKEVDSQSFENIAETTSAIPFASTAFNPKTDTIYVLQPYNQGAEAKAGTNRSGTLIKAFTWKNSKLVASDFYTTTESLSGAYPRIYVLPQRNALVLYWQESGKNPQLRLIDMTSGKAQEVTVTASTCVSEEEDWSDELEDIVMVKVPFSDQFSRQANNDQVVAETEGGFVRFYADTLSIKPTSTLAEFNFTTAEGGAVNANISCSATLKDAAGSEQSINPYQWISKRADGTYFAYGAKGKFAILKHDANGWSTVGTNALSQFEVQGYEYYAADEANKLAYIYSENQDQIWTLNQEGQILDSFPVADASKRVSVLSGLVKSKDGSLIYNATVSGNEVLRRLAPDGTTPVVTKDPESITVEVGTGLGASGTAYFCAEASGTHGELSSYWQVKAPGAKSFLRTSAEGDLGTFTVSAEQNGYEYRVVYKDSSGAVASKPATLTVLAVDNPKETVSSCKPVVEEPAAEESAKPDSDSSADQESVKPDSASSPDQENTKPGGKNLDNTTSSDQNSADQKANQNNTGVAATAGDSSSNTKVESANSKVDAKKSAASGNKSLAKTGSTISAGLLSTAGLLGLSGMTIVAYRRRKAVS